MKRLKIDYPLSPCFGTLVVYATAEKEVAGVREYASQHYAELRDLIDAFIKQRLGSDIFVRWIRVADQSNGTALFAWPGVSQRVLRRYGWLPKHVIVEVDIRSRLKYVVSVPDLRRYFGGRIAIRKDAPQVMSCFFGTTMAVFLVRRSRDEFFKRVAVDRHVH